MVPKTREIECVAVQEELLMCSETKAFSLPNAHEELMDSSQRNHRIVLAKWSLLAVDDLKKESRVARSIFRSFSGAALIMLGICIMIFSSILARWLPSIWFYILALGVVFARAKEKLI